jgi:hypothetical protein
MQLNSKMSGKVDLREIRGDFKKKLKKNLFTDPTNYINFKEVII